MMQNIPYQDLISVCICTFKRSELLESALEGITSQITNDKLLFEIVVVDNDSMRSAEAVVKKIQENSYHKVIYDCEPEQNIALARNRAVRNANGNLIAFIDDDEVPVKDWLFNLFQTFKTTGADGVLGPVLPFYSEEAPRWLNKCNLFDRRRFRTGTKLKDVRDTRTGNVLLSGSILNYDETWFDPAFGQSGGEDINFFKKQITKGRVFIWCDEAVAYETIPPERWKSSFYIKRYFRGGVVNGEIHRKKLNLVIFNLLKSLIAIFIWPILLICSLPLGKHVWFRPLLKLSYFSGYISAICGFSFLRNRE